MTKTISGVFVTVTDIQDRCRSIGGGENNVNLKRLSEGTTNGTGDGATVRCKDICSVTAGAGFLTRMIAGQRRLLCSDSRPLFVIQA